MKNPQNMNPFELRKLAREKGFEVDKTATKAQLLDLLGIKKKGKPSWKPAGTLEVFQKKPGFRYRWCDKDPQNIQRKVAEGWRHVNRETGLPVEHENPDGETLTSSTEYRELVVMALPEDVAQERDAYFREKTRAQTVSLKDRLQDDLDDAAKAHGAPRAKAEGTIVIE